jgi:hypothetical protein
MLFKSWYIPGLDFAEEYRGIITNQLVTIQLTSDLPDSGVKSAHIHLYTARFFPLEQIRGNLNSNQ